MRRGVLLVSSGGLGDTVLFALVVARFQALARDGEAVRVVLRRDAAAMPCPACRHVVPPKPRS